jgi:hypothetical protein
MKLTIALGVLSFLSVDGFTPSLFHSHNSITNIQQHDVPSSLTSTSTPFSTTQLFAKKKSKKSMAEKRKNRGKKFAPKPLAKPEILNTVPDADEWEKVKSTEEQVQQMQKQEQNQDEDEVQSQAKALIETQRKSVEVLTYVKETVLNLPRDKMIESLKSVSGCDKVFNDFLGQELSDEIRAEGLKMFEDEKMELDLKAGLCSGEYTVGIKGGEKQYADCPRITEFVVSLTRHLTGLLNDSLNENKSDDDADNGNDLDYVLDETASMAGLRTFNRMARLNSISLLTGKEVSQITNEDLNNTDQRPFQCVIDTKTTDADGNEEEVDYRKVTAIYFLTPQGWDKSCGGGVTIKNGDESDIYIEAKNDRLLILTSDTCIHRMEEWVGNNEGLESGSMIVTHFIEKRD